MSDPPVASIDQPSVGRPQLSAAVASLERELSDLLYSIGGDLLVASRLVERRQVEAFLPQAETLGAAFVRIVQLHGQLAALDELAGGRLHGKMHGVFPSPDLAVQERLAQFQATRNLERTQRAPWADLGEVPEEPEPSA